MLRLNSAVPAKWCRVGGIKVTAVLAKFEALWFTSLETAVKLIGIKKVLKEIPHCIFILPHPRVPRFTFILYLIHNQLGVSKDLKLLNPRQYPTPEWVPRTQLHCWYIKKQVWKHEVIPFHQVISAIYLPRCLVCYMPHQSIVSISQKGQSFLFLQLLTSRQTQEMNLSRLG